jgi:hypothetical protein
MLNVEDFRPRIPSVKQKERNETPTKCWQVTSRLRDDTNAAVAVNHIFFIF